MQEKKWFCTKNIWDSKYEIYDSSVKISVQVNVVIAFLSGS